MTNYRWTSYENAMAHAEKHGPEFNKTPHRYLMMAKRRLNSPNKKLIRSDKDANIFSDRENNILVVRKKDNKIITFYPRMKKMADFPTKWDITEVGLYRQYSFLRDASKAAFVALVNEYIHKIGSSNEEVHASDKGVEIFISAEPPMRHDFLLAKAFDILYSQSMRIGSRGGSLEAIRKAVKRK